MEPVPGKRGSRRTRYDAVVIVWRAGSDRIECGGRTLVMGVLNVTPDSFSDGGLYLDHEAAVARGLDMVAAGADLLDVGGESTRPGSDPVPATEEMDRVVPVIKRLATEVDVPISVDSRKPQVAAAAVEAGASIVNDISGGAAPGMFDVVREAGAGMQPSPSGRCPHSSRAARTTGRRYRSAPHRRAGRAC